MSAAKDITELGTILFVWAHPDDEAWCAVGLMKLALRNGQRVVMVTATKGDSGNTADEERWPSDELSLIRQEEMQMCLENLEGVEHRWLDYSDGMLADVDSDTAASEIARIIDEVQADTVVTFEPGGVTGHDDHKTVYVWSVQAAKKSDTKPKVLCAVQSMEKYESAGRVLDAKHNIYFNCQKPRCVAEKDADIAIDLDSNCLSCKMECLQAHQSQTDTLFRSEADTVLVQKMAATECFVYAKD